MISEIVLKVNGRLHTVTAEADTPLVYVLRNDLKLKSAQMACGLGQCGACKVLIDGDAVPSCRISVRSAQGREIVTVEGLGTPENLHPLQRAFIEEGAIQCGFCTSGMLISAKALLDRNPQPADAEIKAAMSDNLCRCGVYDSLLRAIKRAAGYMARESTSVLIKGETGDDASSENTDPSAGTLKSYPDIDSWIRVEPDGKITVFTGKVELGQDLRRSLAMIAAEELDVALERITIVMADTEKTPNERYTTSSMSLETSGTAIRHAAAEARQVMLLAAAEKLGVSVDDLTVTDGCITHRQSQRTLTYRDLYGGRRFRRKVEGIGKLKIPADYTIIGFPANRLDLLAKVTGKARFVHDLDFPDMVHGRIVRGPNYGARLKNVDIDAVSSMPGILKVVRDGSFLGVIAEREEQAVSAAAALDKTAAWESGDELPRQEDLENHMVGGEYRSYRVIDGVLEEGPVPPVETPTDAPHTLKATYFRPYHMHASLGPSAAVARMEGAKLTVWSHSQGVYPLRDGIALVLGMPKKHIHAIHVDGAGCYGHNGADDAALDAALLAKAFPGRPVSLKWSRQDEHQWEPYGPAAAITMQASLDNEGMVIDWNHDVWGYTYSGRSQPGEDNSSLLASWYLANPFDGPPQKPSMNYHVGIHRNADPLYAFSKRRIVEHFLPDSPLRTSALRSLGSYANTFAIESFMDELACAAGVDPIDFRLRFLEDDRARAVIEAVVKESGWRQTDASSGERVGRGIGFVQYKNLQSYIAVVAEVKVSSSGSISLLKGTLAADAGQIANPDAVSSQLEGIFIQAASWTLKEQVRFDPQGIVSKDWYSYPVLRFQDAPEVRVVLLNRPKERFLGIGEAGQGPVAAAIANAVFDAAGIRMRSIPFTPERVKEALSELR